MIRTLQYLTALIGGACVWLWGDITPLFIALIVCVCMDYITGVIAAIVTKTISSEIGFVGIAKKIFIFVIVAIAHILDAYVLQDENGLIRDIIIAFYISNESISMIENAVKMGLPVPQKIVNLLEQLKKKGDE